MFKDAGASKAEYLPSNQGSPQAEFKAYLELVRMHLEPHLLCDLFTEEMLSDLYELYQGYYETLVLYPNTRYAQHTDNTLTEHHEFLSNHNILKEGATLSSLHRHYYRSCVNYEDQGSISLFGWSLIRGAFPCRGTSWISHIKGLRPYLPHALEAIVTWVHQRTVDFAFEELFG
ncbi:MAG: hypothetical protein AAGM67_17795, partial [Bacteroidota bacterium]